MNKVLFKVTLFILIIACRNFHSAQSISLSQEDKPLKLSELINTAVPSMVGDCSQLIASYVYHFVPMRCQLAYVFFLGKKPQTETTEHPGVSCYDFDCVNFNSKEEEPSKKQHYIDEFYLHNINYTAHLTDTKKLMVIVDSRANKIVVWNLSEDSHRPHYSMYLPTTPTSLTTYNQRNHHVQHIQSLKISPRGTYLGYSRCNECVIPSQEIEINLLNLTTKKNVRHPGTFTSRIDQLEFTSDETFLIFAEGNGDKLYMWKITSPQPARRLAHGKNTGPIKNFTVSSDNTLIAANYSGFLSSRHYEKSRIFLWDNPYSNNPSYHELEYNEPDLIRKLCFFNNKMLAVLHDSDLRLKIYSIEKYRGSIRLKFIQKRPFLSESPHVCNDCHSPCDRIDHNFHNFHLSPCGDGLIATYDYYRDHSNHGLRAGTFFKWLPGVNTLVPDSDLAKPITSLKPIKKFKKVSIPKLFGNHIVTITNDNSHHKSVKIQVHEIVYNEPDVAETYIAPMPPKPVKKPKKIIIKPTFRKFGLIMFCSVPIVLILYKIFARHSATSCPS